MTPDHGARPANPGPALSAALAEGLAAAGLPAGPLAPMPVKGIAHHHLRIVGTGLVVRVPSWSQTGLDPQHHLDQEAAGFRRAAKSGRTPALVAVLDCNAALATGALVVGDIDGRPPRLPADLPALAQTLARVHALPVPPPAGRPPLADPRHAFLDTLALVTRQAEHFGALGLDGPRLALLEDELGRLHCMGKELHQIAIQPVLQLSDTHPGNFLIDHAGTAWFVDCEKVAYGLAAIDLAHATLFTSTTWDPDCAAVLSSAEVGWFYRTWMDCVPARIADASQVWLAPARRLVWLRTLSWMARWRTTREGRADHTLPPALRHHIRARIDAFFDPATLIRVRDELDGFTAP